MNIINKLTIRHMKGNKRRTLVTIIGVVISVAMLTAVATLGVSFLDLMKRDTIAQNGEWHVKYNHVNSEQIESIRNDKETNQLILTNNRGYAKFEGIGNENKPYLFIKEYNKEGLNNFPVVLSGGRLPQTRNEIVISEEITKNATIKYKIGDQLTLEIGDRALIDEENITLNQQHQLQVIEGKLNETLKVNSTETYTIVGFIKRPTWEPTWAPGYTVISYVDEKILSNVDTLDALVKLNKVNGNLYDNAESFAKKNQIDSVSFNKDLLTYYGITDNDEIRKTLFSVVGIIMIVIIFGSASLIYNAFAISVSERSRHLGMLSSVGATKKQKRNSVFFEGAVIGAISIPLGFIAGIVGIGITFWFINTFLEGSLGVSGELKVVITPITILISALVSIVTIFISTYLPAKKASKVSAIDAIRQTQDVKLSGKKVKTSRLVRKIFGIEAEIGLKNLKRNKRRYNATIFSLVISIVLFLSVSFFTDSLKKSVELATDSTTFDIVVTGKNNRTDELKNMVILDGIASYNFTKQLDLKALIDESTMAEELKNSTSLFEDGKYPYDVVVHGLDKESFKDYVQSIGADLETFEDSENPKAIVIDRVSYQATEKFVKTKAINIELGETIDLYHFNYETKEKTPVDTVEVGALTDQYPVGQFIPYPGALDIIVSESKVNSMINSKIEDKVYPNLFLNSSDPIATQTALEDVKESDMNIFNNFQRRQQEAQMISLISLFSFGFIGLITLISIANIFNTISTSISLRRREFAMLKSVGMTSKGFNKMINYESIFYGIKALLYGLPISIGVMVLLYLAMKNTFEYGFTLPWLSIVVVIMAVFLIVSSAMLYSISKIKKDNIIDTLKQESI